MLVPIGIYSAHHFEQPFCTPFCIVCGSLPTLHPPLLSYYDANFWGDVFVLICSYHLK